MNIQLLIDSIVRQTMVLIGQIATTSGSRAPLARVANQVFLNLSEELRRQGLSQRVVADMFGIALRSYQQKVQRLSESATDSGKTLWEAMHGYLQEKQVVGRAEFLRRFSSDNEVSVKGILNDFVESGLAYRTGRGDSAVYRNTPVEDLARSRICDPVAPAASLVWVAIYRDGPLTRKDLTELVPLEEDLLDKALGALIDDGRVTLEKRDGTSLYASERWLVPLGDDAGWEAGLLDQYRSVIGTMCAKLRNGATRALPSDRIGGSTYSFDIWPGHPGEDRVYGLLASHRQDLSRLWNEISEHNEKGKPQDGVVRVTFYFGQNVVGEKEDDN